MRYKFLHIISCLLFVLASCSENGVLTEPDIGGDGEGITDTLYTIELDLISLDNNSSTRADLKPPYDEEQRRGEHHVNYVQLYVFEGKGDDAVCIGSEDVKWRDYFLKEQGALPNVSAQMRYRVQTPVEVGQEYTLMAVGVEMALTGSPLALTRNATFGWTAGEGLPGIVVQELDADGTVVVPGTTLDEAQAQWAATATHHDMAATELFCGVAELTAQPTGFIGVVEMFRRVAGVMGYFTNVPTEAKGEKVTHLQIRLYQEQNRAVPLLRRMQSPLFWDYIASSVPDDGSTVLMKLEVPEDRTETIFGGVYLMPVPAPTVAVDGKIATLWVDLVNASGTILHSRRVKLPDDDPLNGTGGGGTGIIDPDGASCFPIIANHYYGIGGKGSPVNVGGENDIVISVDPMWEEIYDNPSVVPE